MPHAIPERIELGDRYSKPIRQRRSRKEAVDGGLAARDRTAWVSIDGQVLDKPIQIYRMWYHFLQLALELERQGVQIITKEKRVPLKTPKKDAYGHLRKSFVQPIKHKVRVDRSKYEGWDLDIIPDTSFNEWWKGSMKKEVRAHQYLFLDESTAFINSKDEWVDDSNYQYVRIDKRKRANDIMIELRGLISNQKDWSTSSTSKFPVTGMPNINTLINRYNALLVKLTTKNSDEEIFKMGVFRTTQIGMEGTIDVDRGSEDVVSVYKLGANYGRAMRDLILPAKISLLSVCDGYFVKHPEKTYL
jgi:hypothetical protein